MAGRKPKNKTVPQARPKKRPKYGGRKAGTPNKATASVKEALSVAFDARGGVAALLDWADLNPTEFYKLWAKMLPAEVRTSGTLTLEVVEQIVDADSANDVFSAPHPG